MQIQEKLSRKDEIIQKASELFMEKGFTGTSVRDIAQYIGMEAPSLYFHFKSKEEILQQICFSIANSFMKGISNAENFVSPVEKLEDAIQTHISILIENQAAAAILWNDWKHMKDDNRAALKELRDEYEGKFQSFIIEGIELGVFKNLDSSVATKVLLSMLNGITSWYRNDMDLNKELISIEISNTYLKGIINQ